MPSLKIPCGLRNPGVNCYINSTVQVLGHTKLFRCFIRASDFGNMQATADGKILYELKIVLDAMWSGTVRIASTDSLRQALSKCYGRFDAREEDAHELLMSLLNSVHAALKPFSLPHLTFNAGPQFDGDNSFVSEYFKGLLKYLYRCMECSTVSCNFEVFSMLSLALPDAAACSITECFELFAAEDQVEKQCVHCDCIRKCKVHCLVQSLPKYLIVQLKRFTISHKICSKVFFSTQECGLDMKPYCVDNVGIADYSLYGIINHRGNLESEHYWATCNHLVEGVWQKYDDKNVEVIEEGGLVTDYAYMLFYELADSVPESKE